jgi:hypothetical protein
VVTAAYRERATMRRVSDGDETKSQLRGDTHEKDEGAWCRGKAEIARTHERGRHAEEGGTRHARGEAVRRNADKPARREVAERGQHDEQSVGGAAQAERAAEGAQVGEEHEAHTINHEHAKEDEQKLGRAEQLQARHFAKQWATCARSRISAAKNVRDERRGPQQHALLTAVAEAARTRPSGPMGRQKCRVRRRCPPPRAAKSSPSPHPQRAVRPRRLVAAPAAQE